MEDDESNLPKIPPEIVDRPFSFVFHDALLAIFPQLYASSLRGYASISSGIHEPHLSPPSSVPSIGLIKKKF